MIKMSNDPPLGTYANTKISLNGEILPVSAAGKGWVINEDQLIAGTNTLDFDSGPFILNGLSTLDLVRLLYLIIYDEYDNPMQSVVMDLDGSGYNGIGDLRQVSMFKKVRDQDLTLRQVFLIFHS